MYQWQRIHFFDELERNGHTIEVFNPLHYASFEEANNCLLKFIKTGKIHFDFFLSCEGSNYLFKQTIELIKSIGLRTVLQCFDNLHAPHMHKKIAPSFDIVWLTSIETLDMFKQWGCNNIIFQSYAANPFKFIPRWDKSEYAVSFIGNPYGSRVNKLNILTQSNVLCKVYSDSIFQNTIITADVERQGYLKLIKSIINAVSFDIGRKVVYGALKNKYLTRGESNLNRNNFLHELPSVSFLEMQKIYSNSSLSLNITELRNTYVLKSPIHKMHLRTFEIPMCGGLQIAPYTDELAGYFEEDKEIILYKSENEFVSKSKFYLDPKNEALSLLMKKNARKRAETDHTWMNRFSVLFSKL
jgi:spore maturation protein CgeB